MKKRRLPFIAICWTHEQMYLNLKVINRPRVSFGILPCSDKSDLILLICLCTPDVVLLVIFYFSTLITCSHIYLREGTQVGMTNSLSSSSYKFTTQY